MVAEVAHVARAQQGPQAAVDTIADSGLDLTDAANTPALFALVDNLLALDEGRTALARIDAALARNPEDPDLHALRGTVLSRAKSGDEARQAFETACDLDPENAAALGGLAALAGNSGDYPKAVELFELHANYADDSAVYSYSAAQLTLEQGDTEGAMERLRRIIRKHPGHAGSRNDLAWLLAESGGNLDTALSLAEDAQRLDPTPDIIDTLGWVHIKRGDGAAAAAALEKALEMQPDSASIRYHLGAALALAGDADRAREMLQSAVEMEGFADVDAARRELAKLER